MYLVLEIVPLIRLRKILLCNWIYIVLSLIALIYSLIMMNWYTYQSKYDINEKELAGYIHSYKIDGDKLNILLIGKEKIIINYYFKSLSEKESFALKLGDYIKVSGTLNKPKAATVFNLFNYRNFLYHKRIFFICTATSISYNANNTRLRYKIKQIITDHINSLGASSTYVKALVIGDDDGFSNEINNSYQFNGVSHLFAISGSHISFLAIIILYILKKLKVEENKRYYTVMIFLLFYMFLTDYAGSVLRAVVFFSILSINKMYYFNIKTTNVLLMSGFILLIFKPDLLYDVGFQFSFLISFYLIVFQQNISIIHNYVKQTLLISVIAFLVSIPICINNFFQINMLSPIINVFFVPYVSFILFPLSFLILFFPFLNIILVYFINILESISLFVSNIKIGEIILSKPSFIIIILYYIIITFCIIGLINKRYKAFILLGIVIIAHSNINYFNFNPQFIFLDVGQGDSSIIILPNNKGTILIDTGGKLKFGASWQHKNREYKIGEDTIIPYLKSIGIKKLNYLILTHGDDDHMGESIDIIKRFKVDKIIINNGTKVPLEKQLLEISKSLNIPFMYGKSGDVININNYKLYILNPITDTNENDNSLVIYTKLNNFSMLLTGDISTKVEQILVKKYDWPPIDLVKIAHHGSKTSTSELFLDVIKPKYSIIQVGLNNRFKHPSPQIIDRLKKRNIKILQTSIVGTIKVIIESNDFKIMTAIK